MLCACRFVDVEWLLQGVPQCLHYIATRFTAHWVYVCVTFMLVPTWLVWRSVGQCKFHHFRVTFERAVIWLGTLVELVVLAKDEVRQANHRYLLWYVLYMFMCERKCTLCFATGHWAIFRVEHSGRNRCAAYSTRGQPWHMVDLHTRYTKAGHSIYRSIY